MKDMSAIADVELPTSDGETVRLRELWSERPVVISWLRHYG